MGKIIFWLIVILAALLGARLLARQHEKSAGPRANGPARARHRAAPAMASPEAMVRCAHCGIHMPRSEAMLIGGQTWCSTEHAKLGARE